MKALLILRDALLVSAVAAAVGAVGCMFAIDTGLALDQFGRIVLFLGAMAPLPVEWPSDGIVAALRRGAA
jgi:hypothetical protein